MTVDMHPGTTADQWPEVRAVITGPLPGIAARFSRWLAKTCPHDALVTFTPECTGRPRTVAGAAEFTEKVTTEELRCLRDSPVSHGTLTGDATIGGAPRPILGVLDPSQTLLVIVPRPSRSAAPDLGGIAAVFGIVATSFSNRSPKQARTTLRSRARRQPNGLALSLC
jgi:hypothetical protein